MYIGKKLNALQSKIWSRRKYNLILKKTSNFCHRNLFETEINKMSWQSKHFMSFMIICFAFCAFQRYDYETENLQSLALQLGCKARSLFNEVQPRNLENDPNMANHSHSSRSRPHQLSVEILSSVADLIITLKCVTQWLDR